MSSGPRDLMFERHGAINLEAPAGCKPEQSVDAECIVLAALPRVSAAADGAFAAAELAKDKLTRSVGWQRT